MPLFVIGKQGKKCKNCEK